MNPRNNQAVNGIVTVDISTYHHNKHKITFTGSDVII